MKFLKKQKYVFTALLLGLLIAPLGHWSDFGKGFVVFADSLIGLSAAFTAWWAYKTFAFKERITEYKSIYEGLKNAELIYVKKFGAHAKLINTLIIQYQNDVDIREEYIRQLSQIDIEYKQAEDFLNDLYFSPFVSNNFKAKLLLLIRAKDFEDALQVQDSFFKIKSLHRDEFLIKT